MGSACWELAGASPIPLGKVSLKRRWVPGRTARGPCRFVSPESNSGYNRDVTSG